jgi:hypothetical protein
VLEPRIVERLARCYFGVVGWLKDTYEIASNLARILSKPARAVRHIPQIDEFVRAIKGRFLNPIVVYEVTNPDNADLLSAFERFEARIPDQQRVEPADIARWLTEYRKNRRNADATRDCFLVAKYEGRVCGFALFHYFPTRRLVFFFLLRDCKKTRAPDWNL